MASESGYLWKTTARKGVDYYEVSKSTAKEKKVLDEVDESEKKEQTKEQLKALLFD